VERMTGDGADLVTHRYRDGVERAIPQTRWGLVVFLSPGTRVRFGYSDVARGEMRTHEATVAVERATWGSIVFQDGSAIRFAPGSRYEFGPFGFRVEHPKRTYWFRYAGIDEALALYDAARGKATAASAGG